MHRRKYIIEDKVVHMMYCIFKMTSPAPKNFVFSKIYFIDYAALPFNWIKSSFHFFQCFPFCFRDPFPCKEYDKDDKRGEQKVWK